MQKNCWSKSSEKSKKIEESEEKNESKHKENGLSASSVFKASDKNNQIIADSGASIHLTRNLEWFSSIGKLSSPVALSIANALSIAYNYMCNSCW